VTERAASVSIAGGSRFHTVDPSICGPELLDDLARNATTVGNLEPLALGPRAHVSGLELGLHGPSLLPPPHLGRMFQINRNRLVEGSSFLLRQIDRVARPPVRELDRLTLALCNLVPDKSLTSCVMTRCATANPLRLNPTCSDTVSIMRVRRSHLPLLRPHWLGSLNPDPPTRVRIASG